jgi:hypothetical protein
VVGEKGHAMVGGEIAKWHSDEFEFVSGRVENLHITRDVLLSPDLAEVGKGFVGDISEI